MTVHLIVRKSPSIDCLRGGQRSLAMQLVILELSIVSAAIEEGTFTLLSFSAFKVADKRASIGKCFFCFTVSQIADHVAFILVPVALAIGAVTICFALRKPSCQIGSVWKDLLPLSVWKPLFELPHVNNTVVKMRLSSPMGQ